MEPQMRPLPALYVIYVLRSSIRHSSVYIGSTPNPPRRLKQHNGDAKGGAKRTSRDSLRPWEMVVLVSGFPSSLAALKFEWALNNPHISLHIPQESRVAVSSGRKKSGMPRRKPHNLQSVVSNLHVLTGVPSFARWPLNLHFLAPEAHTMWTKWIDQTGKPANADMKIFTDFGPVSQVPGSRKGVLKTVGGIHSLLVDYSDMKEYVKKAHDVVSFEQEGKCVHCKEELESSRGLHPICPNDGCNAMGHLDCWSRHALSGKDESDIIPTSCECPSCGGSLRWADMMKELSLRIRGPKEVDKLLTKKKVGRPKKIPDDDDYDDA